MTARWVVEEVVPQRDLNVTWQPISLYFKNEPAEDSDYHAPVLFTHKLLRVMEAVRVGEGEDAVFRFYWEVATRIHHDKDRDFDPGDALDAIGLDRSYAEAFEQDKWDVAIRERMDAGLELAGNDIGTPIIAFDNRLGKRVAYFGPVITRVPTGEYATDLWDGLVTLATVDGFWELKRTRTERPDVGDRP